MAYTLLQARALANGGAVTSPTAAAGNATPRTSAADGHKQKKKRKAGGSANGASTSNAGPAVKKVKRPSFRTQQQLEWLREKKLCFHCCLPGHASPECEKKKNGSPAANIPAAFKSAKA